MFKLLLTIIIIINILVVIWSICIYLYKDGVAAGMKIGKQTENRDNSYAAKKRLKERAKYLIVRLDINGIEIVDEE